MQTLITRVELELIDRFSGGIVQWLAQLSRIQVWNISVSTLSSGWWQVGPTLEIKLVFRAKEVTCGWVPRWTGRVNFWLLGEL